MTPGGRLTKRQPTRVLEDRPFASSYLRLTYVYERNGVDREDTWSWAPIRRGRPPSDELERRLLTMGNDDLVDTVEERLTGPEELPDRISRGLPDADLWLGEVTFLPEVPIDQDALDTTTEFIRETKQDLGGLIDIVVSAIGPSGDVAGLPRPLLQAPTIKMEFLTIDQVEFDGAELEARMREQADLGVDVFGTGTDVVPANGFVVDTRVQNLTEATYDALDGAAQTVATDRGTEITRYSFNLKVQSG